MVSMVSSFKRRGWDSFRYVLVLCRCVGCSSSSITGPWLVWSAVSKEEGGIVSCMYQLIYSCVGCSSSITGPWLVWSAISKEEGGIVSRM